MNESAIQKRIKILVESLENKEVIIYDLGTPQIAETEEVRELVALGNRIVPYLMEMARTAKPKVVAYIVLVLSKLTSENTVIFLHKLKARYQAIESKTEWEYAVIGQCNVALYALD